MFQEVPIINLSIKLNLNGNMKINNYLNVFKEIYFESKRRYGAIKVHRQLIKEGLSVSLKRVQRLMKSADLVSIIQKKYIPYKQSKELVLEHENIVKQDFSTTSINQK